LFLAVSILEIFLRILGAGYKLFYAPPVDRRSEYKIFCVGESTTFGIGASNPILYGYPRQLETMLTDKFPESDISCFF